MDELFWALLVMVGFLLLGFDKVIVRVGLRVKECGVGRCEDEFE